MKVFAAELLKLKRSRVALSILAVSVLPLLAALPQLLRQRTQQGMLAGEEVLAGFMEFWALGVFFLLVIFTCLIFSQEHQNNTIHSLTASPHSMLSFLAAKLVASGLVLSAALVPALLVRVLAACFLATTPPNADLLIAFGRESILYIAKNLLLIPWVAAVATLVRRLFPSVLVGFAFIVMTFPFHRTDYWYFFPWLAAAMHFTKAFGFSTPDNAGVTAGWISLSIFAAACTLVCVFRFRRR